MKHVLNISLLLLFAPAPAGANGIRWQLEPAHIAVEVLDSVYEERLGLASGTAVRIAYGLSARRNRWTLAVQQGHTASPVDFGLLEDARTRLHRVDTSLEVRWMSPEFLFGWRLQPALGLGRLDLRYNPDELQFIAGGQTVQVSLDPVHHATRHLAAELLHVLPRQTQLVLRASWRFYELDLATPTGPETRSVDDLQAGIAIRVSPFSGARPLLEDPR